MLLLAVLFGVFFGSYRSLHRYEQKAERVFYSGVEEDGLCVSSDLNVIAGEGNNMLTVAKRYLPDSEETAAALNESILSFHSAKDINGKIACALEMIPRIEALAGRLQEEDLSEKDRDYLFSQLAEVASRERTARLDGYNDTAKEYNDQLTGFGGWMAKFYHFQPLTTLR